MLVKKMALNASGYVRVEVEGFFIQRFINLCISKGIFLDNVKHKNKSKIICKIDKNDFKKVCKIAKQTKCKIEIKKKGGIPFFVHKYRKRKIFLIMFSIFIILCFSITRFIWNIDIIGVDDIKQGEILKILANNEIKIGMPIYKIETESLINKIRLERDDISWIGIKVKGTNLILEIVEAEKKPEIVDENRITNIVANKEGIITKINVQSGTARVVVGDEVTEGTLLVEGVMEGKYTGIRYVNSRGDIHAKITYRKSETKLLNSTEEYYSGNEYNQYKINFNNFKINLNKGVSNFQKYDTIDAKNKLRLFSNYYLPIEFEKITYKEKKIKHKLYTLEEITKDLETKLEKDILASIENKYENFIESTSDVEVNNNKVTVMVNCVVEEKIGKNEDLVF